MFDSRKYHRQSRVLERIKNITCIGCIKGESNPRRVDGNDPGYHYPINALSTW